MSEHISIENDYETEYYMSDIMSTNKKVIIKQELSGKSRTRNRVVHILIRTRVVHILIKNKIDNRIMRAFIIQRILYRVNRCYILITRTG